MSKYGTPLIIDDNDLEQELLIPVKNIVMDDQVTTLSDKMADLALSVATAEGKANNVSSSLSTVQTQISDNRETLNELDTTVSQINNKVEDIADAVEDLTDVVNTPQAIATEDKLGVVRVGQNLDITPDGVLNNNYDISDHYEDIPVANNRGAKGLARLGNGLTYNVSTDSIEVNVEELNMPEYSVVSETTNGLMTPGMLQKLNNADAKADSALTVHNLSSTDFAWDNTHKIVSAVPTPASTDKLGAVKAGAGLSITGDGVLSVTKTLEPADTINLGGIIVGEYLTVDSDGRLSVAMATVEKAGLLSSTDKRKLESIPDSGYSGPAATATVDLTGLLVAQTDSEDPNSVVPMVLEENDARAHPAIQIPVATTGNLGAVIVGNGLDIDTQTGVLSVTNAGHGDVSTASTTRKGIVQIGSGINVDSNGIISVSNATTLNSGLMSYEDKQKLENLRQVSEYVLPKASADTLGGIKVGTGLTSDVDGTVSVNISNATTVASGLMSAADKIKLINLSENGGGSGGGDSTYVLPAATADNLGGIKVGTGLTAASDGTLSINIEEASTVASGLMSTTDKRKLNTLENYTLPTAAADTLGGIKVGTGLAINPNGVVSVDIPMATTLSGGSGLMSYEDKRALATLQAASGGDSSYVLYPASDSVLGGVKVGSGLSITGDGVLSATISSGTLDTVTSTQNGLATPAMLSAANSYQAIANNIILSNDLATLTVGNANTVNNHSVNSDVPANAKFTDTTYDLASSSTAGLMSTAQYQDLENLKNNTAGYISGAATADSLGGIKVGSGLEIDRGVLSVTNQIANATTLGSVKIGEGLAVTNDGTISVPVATSTTAGLLTSREKAKLATIPDSGYESGTTVTTSLNLTGFLVAGTSSNPDSPIEIEKLEDGDNRAHPTITLSTATTTDPGLVIVGAGLNIDTQTGILSAVVTEGGSGTSAPATKTTAGIVQIGDGISVNNGVISVPVADSLGSGLMSATDKRKLDTLQNYTLPVASTTEIGGIKLGAGLSKDTITSAVSVSIPDATTVASGLMSSSDKSTLAQLAAKPDYSLPKATNSELGGIVVGSGLNVSNGVLSVPVASTTQNGLISKEDLTKLKSINVNDGSSSSFITTELSFVNFMVAHTIEGSDAIEPYTITEGDPYAHVSLTVPNATKNRLGVVRAGDGIDIDTQTGVISVAESIQSGSSAPSYTAATTSDLGVIKVGSGLSVTNDGTLSTNIPAATTATAGLMSATDKSRLDNLSSTATATGTLALEGFLYVDTTDSTQYQENQDGSVTINPVIRDSSDTPVTVNIPISGMPTATTTSNGLMSSADKAKVENTNAIVRVQTTQPSVSLGDNIVWINPSEKTVYTYSSGSWVKIF